MLVEVPAKNGQNELRERRVLETQAVQALQPSRPPTGVRGAQGQAFWGSGSSRGLRGPK